MTIEVVSTCPLGSKCEEIKDNKIHRCAWSIEIAGQNPQTGEQTNDRGCAMAWMPVLLVDNSRQQRSTAAAVELFRNEMVLSQQAVIGAAMTTGALAGSSARPAIDVSPITSEGNKP